MKRTMKIELWSSYLTFFEISSVKLIGAII